METATGSVFFKFEPIQIVLGDADDTEYADARRLFIFFKTIYYLRSSASSAFLNTNWIDSSYLSIIGILFSLPHTPSTHIR